MKRLVVIVVMALAATACDDGDNKNDEETSDPSSDDPASGSLTAFVIDLIENRTANDTDAIAASEFESLPDPDASNEDAYSSLFE